MQAFFFLAFHAFLLRIQGEVRIKGDACVLYHFDIYQYHFHSVWTLDNDYTSQPSPLWVAALPYLSPLQFAVVAPAVLRGVQML